MTLKEQFIEAFKSGKRFDIKNAEQIADDYALKFAEWQMDIEFISSLDCYDFNDGHYSKKQLLQYFKNNVYGKE